MGKTIAATGVWIGPWPHRQRFLPGVLVYSADISLKKDWKAYDAQHFAARPEL